MHAQERLVVLPRRLRGESPDLYAVHRCIWQALDRDHSSRLGRRFLFAEIDKGVLQVRSTWFDDCPASSVELPESGALRVALAAAPRGCGIEDAQAWAVRLLARNGFEVTDGSIVRRWRAGGLKTDETMLHRISFPAIEVVGRYRLLDRTAAETAYLSGVGRARRFGFGMIRATESASVTPMA